MAHDEHGGAVHVFQSSWAPIIIAAGIFFMNLAFLVGIPSAILGGVILLAGVGQWIREDMRTYRKGSDEGDGHH